MSVAFPREADPVAAEALAAHVATDASDAELAAAVALLQDRATAATDEELDAAVATLTTALTGKQDASTAATDQELSDALDVVNASLASKQEASLAATDVELAAAVSTINSTIAGLPTTSSVTAAVAAHNAATNVHGIADASRLMAFRGAWAAATAYNANDVVTYAGAVYAAIAAFTSGASFNAANWNLLSAAPGTELECNEIATFPGQLFFGSGDTAFRDLAGWTLPALAAQPRPYVLRLVLNHFQIGGATFSVNWQVVKADTAVGTAAVDGTNCWIDRTTFFAAAFATHQPTFERHVAAGVALPALKVRYKGSANLTDGARFQSAATVAGEKVWGRLEQVAR